MGTGRFFQESTRQSRIKTRIVSKYFSAWAQVIVPRAKSRGDDRIAFIDLFAGPGRYDDEMPSTPLHVLGNAVKNASLRDMLIAVFNDVHAEYVESLRKAIELTPSSAGSDLARRYTTTRLETI